MEPQKETSHAPDARLTKPRPERLISVAFATRFLQWGALGLVIPVTNLLKMAKGLSLAELGFSAAFVSAVILLLEVPTGILADRVGRKRVYMWSLLAFGLSCVVLLFARGFAAVTAGFAIYGVSRALSSGSLEALLIDRYIEYEGKDKLPRLIAAANAADTAGLALGSLLGGLLPLAWSGIAPAQGRYDGNLLAMLALDLILAAVVGLAVSEEDVRDRKVESFHEFLSGSFQAIRKDKVLKLLLISMIAWGFAISSVETYWQPRLVQILGSEESSWIFGALSAGYFLFALAGSLLAPRILNKTRVNPYLFLFILRLAMSLFVLLMALQNSAEGFAAVYLIMFFWNGMANPPEGTVLNSEIPSERRASLLSVASLVVQLGGLLGAALFGAMTERYSIPVIWMVAAVVLGSSSVLYLGARRRVPSKE